MPEIVRDLPLVQPYHPFRHRDGFRSVGDANAGDIQGLYRFIDRAFPFHIQMTGGFVQHQYLGILVKRPYQQNPLFDSWRLVQTVLLPGDRLQLLGDYIDTNIGADRHI